MTSGFQDIYTTPDTGGKNKVHAYRKALVLFLLLYGLTNCNWKKSELLQISKKKINSSWVYVHWAQQEKGPSDSILSAIQRSTGAQMNKWRYSYICLEIFQVKKIKILKLFSPKLVVVRWLQHSCQLQNKKPSQLQLLLTVKYFPRDK